MGRVDGHRKTFHRSNDTVTTQYFGCSPSKFLSFKKKSNSCRKNDDTFLLSMWSHVRARFGSLFQDFFL